MPVVSVLQQLFCYLSFTQLSGWHPRLPTGEETRAFIAEYEAARGKPFTYQEHQTLQDAKVYGLAYSARCEHALNPNETTYPEGSSRSLLTQYRKGHLQNNQDIDFG